MRIDVGMMLHSNVPMYEIPIIRSFLYGYKGMCEHLVKSFRFAEKKQRQRKIPTFVKVNQRREVN